MIHCMHDTLGANFPCEASQIGQTFIPYMFKAQHAGRIPIDPAILAAIGHRFIAPKKKKIKNADARV